MALWEFTNLNKHGNYRTRIIYTKGGLGVPGKGLGPVIFANRFKYKHKHPLFPPLLLISNNQKYLMPGWVPVVMETELSDIEWVKAKPKLKPKVITHKFLSSKGDKEYITKEFIQPDNSVKYSCTCPGVWRAKDKKCKHIKNIEK